MKSFLPNGREVSAVHRSTERGQNRFLHSARKGKKCVVPINAADPQNWRKNASGRMEISFDRQEHALSFRTKFPPNVADRWVYPEYILQLPQESLRGASGVSFEYRATPATAVKQMLLMAVFSREKEHGYAINLQVRKPSESWQNCVLPIDKIGDPGKIEMLRIGVNSNAEEITYQIRNFKVLYRP